MSFPRPSVPKLDFDPSELFVDGVGLGVDLNFDPIPFVAPGHGQGGGGGGAPNGGGGGGGPEGPVPP